MNKDKSLCDTRIHLQHTTHPNQLQATSANLSAHLLHPLGPVTRQVQNGASVRLRTRV